MFTALPTSTYQLLVMHTLLASSTNAGPYLPRRRVHSAQKATGSGGGDRSVCRAWCSTRHQHQLCRSDRNRTSGLLCSHVLPGEHLMNQVVGLASGSRRVLRQLAVQFLNLKLIGRRAVLHPLRCHSKHECCAVLPSRVSLCFPLLALCMMTRHTAGGTAAGGRWKRPMW